MAHAADIGFHSTSRSELPMPRTFYCGKCKCCAVKELGDLCAFCEDGVICPEQQRRQRMQQTDVKAPVKKYQTREQVADLCTELEEEIAELESALVNQGWKASRAKSVAARVVADRPEASFEDRFRGVMSGNWGAELAPVKKSAAAVGRAINPKKEEPMPNKMAFDVERYKKLAAKGMKAAEIAAEMGIKVSTLYYKSAQLKKSPGEISSERPPSKAKAKADPMRKKKAPPATSNGHANGNGHADAGDVVTLIVSENALDNFWNTRPLEDKARMVQQELGRA